MDRGTSETLIASLERDAERIAHHFGLRYKSIAPERPNVRSRYGVCFADGSIRIRLRHAVSGRPLKYSSLVNTLCHELAHLRHFNHGPRFKAFYFEVLDFARVRGIYRPGRPLVAPAVVVPAAPPLLLRPARVAERAVTRGEQLPLFSS